MYKEIEAYPNYLISDDGRVINRKHDRELKPYVDKFGYLTVELFDRGIGRQFSVHRLVAKAFIEEITGKGHVNHKDSNRRNNNVDNLEWVTNKENVEHRLAKGTKGKLSKTRIIKLYKSRSWNTVEEFLIEIIKQ